ncbi:MAG: S-methyl-5-thioribose-1-phosphate isomerase [Woeseiaceae bacterium]|nr:S-methyl-5-thioribose-1-phosphate isomerase [Woeseiaceae bacterium]
MPESPHDFRTIWLSADSDTVQIIDQRRLPHKLVVAEIRSWADGVTAINDMYVRGAPLIGATAAWSLYLAARAGGIDEARQAAQALLDSRPTAVNLSWAVKRAMAEAEAQADDDGLVSAMRREAEAICDEDIGISLGIGRSGLELIRGIADSKQGPVNILTHCNAGALATINWGTATAPVYLAKEQGIDVHVWVDETRPRNQGSQLTAWELAQGGVPHTLVVDNAGGHLMQHGMVDIVITGTDRTTRGGDVANKIGTYLKALAARDNDIPFYIALPSTTIDWNITDGIADIPIEEREPSEVSHVYGELNGREVAVNTVAPGTAISNFAFDVTPARLVSGLITERGVCEASEDGLLTLFPEFRR